MKNKNGFTLVEMIVVIVILGIVMSIAAVAVNKYVEKSKKDSYVSMVHEYVTITSDMIAQQKFVIRDQNTVYYIHINNLVTEKKISKSPYGNWVDAYVVVTLSDNNNVNYYWTSSDVKGYRIDLIKETEIDAKDIYHSDNLEISTNQKIDGREKIVVYDKDGNRIMK